MPKITFLPSNNQVDVPSNTKILVAANKAKQEIRFGCASCRCGTCAIRVDGPLSEPKPNEKKLLEDMKLPTEGSIRLACQARVMEKDIKVDLDFQDQYSPDQGYHG